MEYNYRRGYQEGVERERERIIELLKQSSLTETGWETPFTMDDIIDLIMEDVK